MSFELIETCVTPHLHIPINKCLSYTTGASGGTGTAVLLLYWRFITILVGFVLFKF